MNYTFYVYKKNGESKPESEVNFFSEIMKLFFEPNENAYLGGFFITRFGQTSDANFFCKITHNRKDDIATLLRDFDESLSLNILKKEDKFKALKSNCFVEKLNDKQVLRDYNCRGQSSTSATIVWESDAEIKKVGSYRNDYGLRVLCRTKGILTYDLDLLQGGIDLIAIDNISGKEKTIGIGIG